MGDAQAMPRHARLLLPALAMMGNTRASLPLPMQSFRRFRRRGDVGDVQAVALAHGGQTGEPLRCCPRWR